jgi:type IV secretion system protein VirD4
MEQILCVESKLNMESFCKNKTAIFIVLPEEDPTKFFLATLFIQQNYREVLSFADEHGGKLPRRVVYYWDEYGTMPTIQSAEMMFSAGRSRKLSIVAIIQSYAQLYKNYTEHGAEIIIDNCQLTIFGGFAPGSKTAEELSKSMGTYTALAGSVSRNKNDPSQSLNMIERPLMTSDELKSMKKGNFIVMKTGVPPMRATFKLFFKWGIQFDKEYIPEVRQPETIEYADVSRIIAKITGKPVLTSSDLKMQNELKSIFRKVQEDKVNEVS